MYQETDNPSVVVEVATGVRITLPAAESYGYAYARWLAAGNTPEPAPSSAPPTQDQIVASYNAALEARFDEVAKERNYSTWQNAVLRAGYPGTFQEEGAAFATWVDACNIYAVTTMNAVLSGTRALPALEQFLAGLPAMVWPTNRLPGRPNKRQS